MQIQAAFTPPALLPGFFIVLGNLIPLLGVLIWKWDVFSLMFLYWIENIVIGALTILSLLVLGLRDGVTGFMGALFMGTFFTLHYGMFCMAHGLFVLALFHPDGADNLDTGGLFAPIDFILATGLWEGFLWGFAGILLVQLVQIIQKWPDMKDKDFGAVMMSPYARIVILHMTLIFGGFVIMALDQPAGALLILIALKTAFDLGLAHIGRKAKEEPA